MSADSDSAGGNALIAAPAATHEPPFSPPRPAPPAASVGRRSRSGRGCPSKERAGRVGRGPRVAGETGSG